MEEQKQAEQQWNKIRRERLRDGACQIHGHGYAGGFPWL